jgi:hypothetical protein
MNQALFCVMPRPWAISRELTPFLQLPSNQIAAAHFSKPMGLSSKIVLTLTENCFWQARHLHIGRVEMPAMLVARSGGKPGRWASAKLQ